MTPGDFNGVHLAALILLIASILYLPWERLWK